MDGGAIELPWMEMNEFDSDLFVGVKRLDHAVEIKTFDGIKVTFDWHYGMTTVRLNGNYHGHSSGLFTLLLVIRSPKLCFLRMMFQWLGHPDQVFLMICVFTSSDPAILH